MTDLIPNLTITKSTHQPTPQERRAQFNNQAMHLFGSEIIANHFARQFNQIIGEQECLKR